MKSGRRDELLSTIGIDARLRTISVHLAEPDGPWLLSGNVLGDAAGMASPEPRREKQDLPALVADEESMQEVALVPVTMLL